MSALHWLLFSVVLVSASPASGGDVPFTAAGIASLRGKDICDLQGDFPEGVGVFLDHRKEYSVDWLVRDGVSAVFLLSKPSDRCGIVVAVLDLTLLSKNGEGPEFKCYTAHEGGTTWGKWGHIIGLANTQKGRKRFVGARLAWRVNIKEKRFEPINAKTVRCDASG